MKKILFTALIIFAGINLVRAQIIDDHETMVCRCGVSIPPLPTFTLSETEVCPGARVRITVHFQSHHIDIYFELQERNSNTF